MLGLVQGVSRGCITLWLDLVELEKPWAKAFGFGEPMGQPIDSPEPEKMIVIAGRPQLNLNREARQPHS